MPDDAQASEIESLRRELAEARRQQEAIAEALESVTRSSEDRDATFRRLLRTVARLCEAENGGVWLVEGDHLVGTVRMSDDPDENAFLKGISFPLSLTSSNNVRCVVNGEVVQVNDMYDGNLQITVLRDRFKDRSSLNVPIMLNGVGIGIFALTRKRPGVFTETQIALVRSFAAQAAIVVRNVRQFQALETRTAELNEALEQQTATAETLKTLSRSVFDLDAVLDTLVGSAISLCAASAGGLALRRSENFLMHSMNGYSPEVETALRADVHTPSRRSVIGRVLLSGGIEMIPDGELDPEFVYPGSGPGFNRSLLGVPLLRDGEILGVFVLTKQQPVGFTEREIELVKTFADQAVIAIGNVSLFKDLEARTAELRRSLDDLRATQDRLIQTEKLASLGQLTAGVAHEIKNPLNFVNNFSKLSVELLGELGEALRSAELPVALRAEVEDLSRSLTDNLGKIQHHGRRADSIVKNMLLHARQDGGEQRSVDLNALIEESLNLAYHSARAERRDFTIELSRDLDPAVGGVLVFPQEITRVLLNLFSNGFYAAHARAGEPGFTPALSVATKALADRIEVRVRDNGRGVPEAIRDKLFTPFFTTKPAGAGTGLGLSLSYDIIVKQHGGALSFESEPGAFTEFLITLPRGVIEAPRP